MTALREDDIQRAVFQHLRTRVVPGVVAWHTPNGGFRRPQEAARFKGLGTLSGVPDVLALHDGRFFALELKAQGGRPSEAQLEVLARMEAAGAYTGIAGGTGARTGGLRGLGLAEGEGGLMLGPAPVNAHTWERHAQDWYVEPEWCSRRLFQDERFDGTILDPACGMGRVVHSAKAEGLTAFGCDLVDRGHAELLPPSDFFEQRARVDNIVSNPPFNVADRFALHALSLALRKVAIVFPTARLNAAHWLRETPLYRVWLMTPRPSMPPGEVILEGGAASGGKMDFCWLVWLQGYEGTADLRWLRRDKVTS